MRVDLHLHSWVSDGDVSPAEVVRRAAAARLDVIALTDHDTAEGVPEAVREAAVLPVTVVPGIEISTRLDEQELHILGYWIDPESKAIRDHQDSASSRRTRRMEAMVALINGLGLELTMEDVVTAAGTSARTLGRPHLARALHAAGHTRFYSEAFIRFIGDGGPAFVAEGFPEPASAIDIIHEAGGIAVLAHPPIPWVETNLDRLVEWGLDGVECFRPGLDPRQLALLEGLSERYGLLPTGGSDWHGPQRFVLGDFFVSAVRLRNLLSVGGITV